MHNIETILPAVEAYAARHGVLPATVVRKATGNPRLYERLKSRAEKLEEDIGRIAKFLSENDEIESLSARPEGAPDHDAVKMVNGDSREYPTGGAV